MKPLLLALFLLACSEPPSAAPDAGPVDAGPTNKLDLLFLMDDSPGMGGGDQYNLAANLPVLTEALAGLDLHIAVATSSMGAGAFSSSVPGCSQNDDGNFVYQTRAATNPVCQDAKITGPEHYIIDGPTKNYSGNLADVLGCIVQVGGNACGFEHQLAAIRAALGDVGLPAPTGNAGFLRDDARLAIFLITDEDDCSAPPDSHLFDPDDTSLGALASFRCTEYGILCDGQPPPTTAAGPLSNCVSNDARYATDPLHALYPAQMFVDYFKRLKPNVLVFALAAPTQPFTIIVNSSTGDPMLQHSCSSANGMFGDPAVRIKQVLDGVGGTVMSFCQDSYAGAVQTFTSKVLALVR